MTLFHTDKSVIIQIVFWLYCAVNATVILTVADELGLLGKVPPQLRQTEGES